MMVSGTVKTFVSNKHRQELARRKKAKAARDATYDRLGLGEQKLPAGRYRLMGDKAVPIDEAPVVRQADNVNMVSFNLGCAKSQVGEFNRRFRDKKGIGCQFLPDGKVRIDNRQERLKLLAASGMHCHNEVCGGGG